MIPPTIEEVSARVKEMGYTFSAESFVAYYEARGWKLNGKPMVSWKAACVTWQRRNDLVSFSEALQSYPTGKALDDFNKSMVGANPEHYRESFRLRFGLDPK
jgi:hypothetical protein